METTQKTVLTVKSTVHAPVEKVWEFWSDPKHITQWCNPSNDWHAPRATNDLREGGQFSTRMEAKDGSMGFDFGGVYDTVKKNQQLSYTLDDGRKVDIHFTAQGDKTGIVESFDAESMNSLEMQQGGWQAILDNFKHYVEAN